MSVVGPSVPAMSTTGEMPIADIVPTAAGVTRLLAERPACWQWAAFVSVVYQRMRLAKRRRRQLALEPDAVSIHLDSDREVLLFTRLRIRECDDLIRDCDRFMRAPDFMSVFGIPDDDDTADAEGIVRVANRLMDYYERHLELAEECRDCVVPERHHELLRDCTELMVVPLRDYGAFMKGVLARFDEMRHRAAAGDDDIVLAPVLLRTTVDERLVWSVLDRLNDAP